MNNDLLAFYQSIFDHASDGIALVRQDTTILKANRAFAAFYSHTPKDLLGKTVWSLLPEHQQEDAKLLLTRLLACETQGACIEMVVPGISGSSLLLELVAYFNPSEEPRMNTLLLVRDVTHKRYRTHRNQLQSEVQALQAQYEHLLAEQKQVEKELRHSQRLFEAIAKNFPNGAINVLDKLDNTYRLVFTDGEGYRRHNLNPQDYIGKPLEALFSETDLRTAKAYYDKVFQGEAQRFEFEYGGRLYENLAVPLPDESGHISQILTVSLDITERKSAEAEIQEAQSRLQGFINNLPDVSYQFVMEPDGKFYYTFISEQADKIFGIKRDEILANPSRITELIHPDDLPTFYQSLRHSAETLSQFHWLGRVVSNHRTYWLEAFSSPRQQPDGKIIWDGIQFSVTERIEREKQLARFDEQLKLIIKNAPLVLWSIDKDGRITFSEGKGLERLGFASGDAVGFSVFDLYSFNQTFIAHVKRALAGESVEFETLAVFMDSPVAFKHFLQPIRNAQGDVTGVLGISIDSTEEYRAKENELRYRTLANSLPGAVFQAQTQPDGSRKITFVSERIQQFGIAPEEMLGISNSSYLFLHPDDLPSFREALRDALTTFQPIRWEGRSLVKGKTRWIEIAVTPRRADDGFVYWDGIISDISERKAFEQQQHELNEILERQVQERTAALRQSEQLYRAIAENYPNGVVGIYDRSFVLLFTDGTEYKRLGIHTAHLIGRSLYEIYPPDAAATIASYFKEVFNGQTVSFELNLLGNDYFYLVSPIDEAPGQIERILVITQNITERKQSERLLRENEERYRLVLEQTGQIVYDLDLAKGVNTWSGAIEKLTGYAPSDYQLSIDEWAENIYPDDRARATRLLEETMQSGQPYRVEYRYRRKDGSYFWVEDNGIYLKDDTGKPIRMLGTMKDITAQKELEREKQLITEKALQSQKLEAIGTLASGIAHEFNNLLAIISLSNEQIQHLALNPKVREHADIIHKTVKRGSHIARQLLDFSRSEPSEKQPIELNRLIYEITTTLRQLLKKNITVHAVEYVQQAWIMGNDKQLYQVLLNLGINAGDAMPSGGILTYSLSISRYKGARWAVIRVQDTGTGIPPEVKARMFEPFFTTKEVGKGTGLGLSIVHGIVTAHNGKIEVDTELGKGTTFTLLFPLLEQAEDAIPSVPTPVDEHNTETILLAEDEAFLRTLLANTLRQKGYTVLEARDGKEALDCFTQHADAIHLVLTDLGMPNMDGYQLIDALRRQNPNLKILAMTGYLDSEQSQTLVSENLELISKPFDMMELLVMLRNLLVR